MSQLPKTVTDAVQVAKTAQILAYIRENQLLTALGLFILWQAGAFVHAANQVSGVVC